MKTMIPFILFASIAGSAHAQTPVGADGMLPPSLRNRPPDAAPPAAGAALRAQALTKLEAQFRAADRDGDGKLSPEEAKAFGFVARHFADIDTAGHGAVSFEDVRAYLAKMKAGRR
jgi:hypothetical protein